MELLFLIVLFALVVGGSVRAAAGYRQAARDRREALADERIKAIAASHYGAARRPTRTP